MWLFRRWQRSNSSGRQADRVLLVEAVDISTAQQLSVRLRNAHIPFAVQVDSNLIGLDPTGLVGYSARTVSFFVVPLDLQAARDTALPLRGRLLRE
jgi:hypothetical protein